MTLDTIRDEIRESWGDVPVGETALAILEVYIHGSPEDRLSFGDLTEATNLTIEQIAPGLAALTQGVGCLNSGYLWQDGDVTVPVEHSKVPLFGKKGAVMAHPITGEDVADWMSHVVPVFSASERLTSAISASQPGRTPR